MPEATAAGPVAEYVVAAPFCSACINCSGLAMARRLAFAAAVLAFAALGCKPAVPDSPARPPNIVFILIDDLGWADLPAYGNAFHETPHIDRLAAEGMRFTNAYAAAPVCSPTRVSIQSGQ